MNIQRFKQKTQNVVRRFLLPFIALLLGCDTGELWSSESWNIQRFKQRAQNVEWPTPLHLKNADINGGRAVGFSIFLKHVKNGVEK